MARRLVLNLLAAFVVAATVASQAEARPRDCGRARNGLEVLASGPTSCPFARATARAWLRHGAPHPRRLRVYSSVTHRHYRMYCRIWHGNGNGNNYQHGL